MDLEDDLVRFQFDKSPAMSTYLVAFVIGQFDYIERTIESGTLVRVYTPIGEGHLGQLAMDVSRLWSWT